MGTRNLTMVVIDGEYKVAQYGQWDGYPEGQGKTCLNFLHKLMENSMLDEFAGKVRKLREYTKEDIESINKRIDSGEIDNWQKKYPALTRDTGAEILDFILDSPDGEKVYIDLNFAADSLFCEWAWLIDLDKKTFEAYRGFNHKPLTEEDRFYFLVNNEADSRDYLSGEPYHAIVKIAEWDLENLPTEEEFLNANAFNEDEED